ncbi:MAG TPA: UDP-2,3-diacylglucosamine diphosphatase [Gemmataceae bacterium]|jgi:UDP-2,3-diacylglucosamine pyrophosphatase LpxH|nr:UDP-2,3-diacylglucosamine diphosphatase [Gemmataceae bacterium]
MDDALIVSDIHLGSDVCQAKLFVDLLDQIKFCELQTRQLILNGDVFDSWDFRRLKKHHWKVLSHLRKLSDHLPITWINGNHDGPAEIVSHLLGVNVAEEHIFESGGKKVLALHGHQFDRFIDNHPILTALADFSYQMIQIMDRSFYWARLAKRRSKTFLRCSELIEQRALEYARKKSCDLVCCGHTHLEVEQPGKIGYFNSGCWTELPCSYLTVAEGEVRLHHFVSDRKPSMQLNHA